MQEDNDKVSFFPAKVSSLMIQWCHHSVQLSSNSVCAISQVSPTISKPKATVARNQNSTGDRNGEKTLGETKLSQGALSVEKSYIFITISYYV